MINLKLLPLLLCCFSQSLAQTKTESTALEKVPTEKQELKFPHGLTLSFGALTPGLNLEADLPDTKVKTLNYLPSTQGKTFAGFDYNNYGLSISTFNPKQQSFRTKFGNGHAEDYQFRFLYRELYFEALYHKYRGYYLDKPERVMTNPYGPNQENPQFKDLKTEHYGFQLIKFAHLENFSPKRAFDFTEKPKGSGGSWFYSGSINRHRLSTPTSIVPATAIDNYGQLIELRSAETLTVAVGGGGAYSYVFMDHWIASGLFGISLGTQMIKARYTNKDEESGMGTSKLLARIGFGYSGDKFFGGIQGTTDVTSINNSSTHLNLSTTQGAGFFGWRFD